MIARLIHSDVAIKASINIPATNIMRFGPAGFTGTVALLSVVNAGVRS